MALKDNAELAARVIHYIETGSSKPATRLELFLTTSYYESCGDEFRRQGLVDLSTDSLNLAILSCKHHNLLLLVQGEEEHQLHVNLSTLLLKQGTNFMNIGIIDAAIACFIDAQLVFPHNYQAKLYLAVMFILGDQVAEAAAIVQGVLNLPPSCVQKELHEQFVSLKMDIIAACQRVGAPIRFYEGRIVHHSPKSIKSTFIDITRERLKEPADKESGTTKGNKDVEVETSLGEKEAEGACAIVPSTSEQVVTKCRESYKTLLKEDNVQQKEMKRIDDQLVEKITENAIKAEEKRKINDLKEAKESRLGAIALKIPKPTPKAIYKEAKTKQAVQPSQLDVEKTMPSVPKIDIPSEKSEVKEPHPLDTFNKRFAFCFACPNCYGSYAMEFQPDLLHTCDRSIFMVKSKSSKLSCWTKVRRRPEGTRMYGGGNFHGRFKLCKNYEAGRPCRLGEEHCPFGHSEEECSVWTMDLKNTDFTLSTFMNEQQTLALVTDVQRRLECNDGPANVTKLKRRHTRHRSAKREPEKHLPQILCPYQIEMVCGSCWKISGVIATKKGNTCSTIGFHHIWDKHHAFLLKPENDLIRNFDPIRKFMCHKYIRNERWCSYENACTLIHGKSEEKIYKWMAANQIQRLEDVVKLGRKKAVDTNIFPKVIQTVQPDVTQLPNEPDFKCIATQCFCHVCNEKFNDQISFDKHCTSRKHEKNLLTDKERPWHYRPPPWGGDYPRLCNGLENGWCPYAGKTDMYNQCMYAHNTLELDEWKERTDHFNVKKSIMRNPGVFSYVHKLQEEFAIVKLESDMMMMEVNGVELDVTPDTVLFTDKKNASYSWTFTISSQFELGRVALLLDESRVHFRLCQAEDKLSGPVHVEDGLKFLDGANGDTKYYTVVVAFEAGLFGSFKQKVIFDFGTRPLLVAPLDVEVGTDFVRDEIRKLRKEHHVERWTSQTHSVIPFAPSGNTEATDEELLCRYKPPDKMVFSQDNLIGDLNHYNYVHRMRSLVDMEELERAHVASKFNVTADVELTSKLTRKDEFYAPVKHLFGRVPLVDTELSEDSDAGFLILHGAVSAWVGLPATPDEQDTLQPTVYEAQIVCEQNFGFDGRGKDYFFVCLSKSCCRDLCLKDGAVKTLSVQLQIDRLPMCRMRYGLDHLSDHNVVFPDLVNYKHCQPTSTKDRLPLLTTTQQEVVDHMVQIRTLYTPPLIMYGPFGSGKTETLAKAVDHIIRIRTDTRILICALNDSATDLYITCYLHKSKNIEQNKILRVYPPTRWSNSVPDILQPYCQKKNKRLKLPDIDDVKDHQVIITTLATSLMLTGSNMRGLFTHIIIDEAGQCLECEAILPLTLATNTTCVVIAGDHLQLGPKSFSAKVVPKRLKLEKSILERLFLYYSNNNYDERLAKLLKTNFRSHPKIISFISEKFYQNAITTNSDILQWAQCENFKPLTFHATSGKESSDADTTSYYNMSEVNEVVEQITNLYENWPESWGKRQAHKIAVLTPYSQQIQKVKAALVRSNQCYENIKVSQVSDVQGDEFDAVFLSTVRTHPGSTIHHEDDTFGFFSDLRLVNTALTRAKYHVAVVGHPASLTSFGPCMNIWRSYLDWCTNDASFFPKSLTLEDIRQQTELLKEKPEIRSLLLKAQRIFDISQMEPDEILQKLKYKREARSSNMQIIESDQNSTIARCLEIESRSDDKIIYHQPKTKWTTLPMVDPLYYERGDDDDDDDDRIYYDEEDTDDEYDDISSDDSYIDQDCDQDEILALLKKSETYKHCIISIGVAGKTYAWNINKNDKVQIIAIPSKLCCDRACNGDEVVMELIQSSLLEGEVPKGRVVKISKRVMDYKNFVCTVDPYNHSMFIPLNKSFPRIRNKTDEFGKKKGVAVYAPFKKHQDPQFVHYEKINLKNPSEKLFVIRYLEWKEKHSVPEGIVVDNLLAPTTFDGCEILLRIDYNLSRSFKTQTKKAIAYDYDEDFTLSEHEINQRTDFRQVLTFTIDPKGCKVIDDALSIEENVEGLRISIHIADVSYFVDKSSACDKEAKQRCLTYNPSKEKAICMLPRRLSEELCSLLPNCDRLSITVVIQVGHKDYNQIDTLIEDKSIIRSVAQLTYSKVQEILDKEVNGEILGREEILAKKICLLNKVAKAWRLKRLGDLAHVYKPTDGEDTDAHRLVEEMMIKANHEVAKILTLKNNDNVPLRVQRLSTDSSPNVVQPDVVDHGKRQQTRAEPKVSITDKTFSLIQDAVKNKDRKALKLLIASDMLHPENLRANLGYRNMEKYAKYICSGDNDLGSAYHAGVGVEPYCHFTSPLRRYIDIVVHRLVKGKITYKKDEVEKICEDCNNVTVKQLKYEEDVHELEFNMILKENPLVVYGVVNDVQEMGFSLSFPTLAKVSNAVHEIRYSQLELDFLPKYEKKTKEVTLEWEWLEYKDHERGNRAVGSAASNNSRLSITPTTEEHLYVTQIPTSLWQTLNECIKSDEMDCLLTKAKDLIKYGKPNAARKRSQVKNEDPIQKYLLNMFPSQVHKIQLTIKQSNDYRSSQIQLIKLPESLDICVEHHTDPITCFGKMPVLKVTRSFGTVDEYSKRWKPLIHAEGIYQAITTGDSYLLGDISINWTKEEDSVMGEMGEIRLDQSFCSDNNIFNHDQMFSREMYLCVRHNGLDIPAKIVHSEIVEIARGESTYCFVGHCLVVHCEMKNTKNLIKFRLHQSSTAFPEQLLEREKHRGTIQVFSRPTPMSKQLQSLDNLNRSEMAKLLACRKDLPVLDYATKRQGQQWTNKDMPKAWSVPSNPEQLEAVAKALTQSFTLIHGPPGTGKTVTGVKIAYLFAQINRTDPASNQKVLYCGPSNKSVEVVAASLKKVKSELNLVRVYSSDIVQIIHPEPIAKNPRRLKSEAERKNLLQGCQHQDISLHELIRKKAHCLKYAKEICDYDLMFKNEIEKKEHGKRWTNDDIDYWKEEVKKFKKLIKAATEHVLLAADIVLVTCTGSASKYIVNPVGHLIKQVIIDEAAMCTEPESLVPLTSCTPAQVVLIGDPKQLRPIVVTDVARRLGMNLSMFERYERFHKLTIQYRMHEAIQALPSKLFYEDSLKLGKEIEQTTPSCLRDLWPGGIGQPIAFVDVRGKESVQVITTADGNQQSKYNLIEAALTAEIVTGLISKHHINPKCILVLSHYRAQCKSIREQLNDPRCEVTTIVKSQGSEIDYVVLCTTRSIPNDQIEHTTTASWRHQYLGIVDDENQLNVALTRARKGLIIIGNRALLSTSTVWKRLFAHYMACHAIETAKEFQQRI